MSDQTVQRPKIISRKWLDERGACREQAQLFERVWPDGVAVTRETLELSAKKGLRLEWFAERVLPRSDYAAFQSQRAALYAAYQAQIAPMVADYQAQLDTLYADYKVQRDTMEADSTTQIARLEVAYRAQRDTLLINAVCNLYGSDAPALPSSSSTPEAGN